MDQLKTVTFKCNCGERFSRDPDRVEDFPEDSAHPWEYYAECPMCGADASQAHWERNLMKAHLNATGPRTPEGKAKSAKNLEGAQTPEIRARTRFNAMKHGVYARTATYFPAKPGKYPHCENCQFIAGCSPGDPCQKRTELFLRHHVAAETQNPKLLAELGADMQASVFAVMQDMLIAIIGRGVEIQSPVWYYDKEGACHFVEYTDEAGQSQQLMEIEANPLLKPLIDFLNKNNMTLGDMNLTAKQAEEEPEDLGLLADQSASREQLLEFQSRQTNALENLSDAIARGKDKLSRDPVLIENNQ